MWCGCGDNDDDDDAVGGDGGGSDDGGGGGGGGELKDKAEEIRPRCPLQTPAARMAPARNGTNTLSHATLCLRDQIGHAS
jgi:hypothetical protein